MKVLFVSFNHYEPGSGGKVITRRNKEFVEKYFGIDNVFPMNTSLKNEIKTHSVENVAEQLGVDAVFLDTSLFGPYSNSFYKKNYVFTFFHNVELHYYNQIKENSVRQRIRKIFVKYNEKRNCQKSYKVISLNERDSTELERIYGRRSDFILSSSMKDEYSGAEYQVGEYLLFVGTDFYGNTDGLFPFIENCMERINCNLKVVGNGMEKYAGRYDAKYRTEFIGFVDDLESLYANAKAVVLPIVSGSGMKTKTCEALMYGKYIFGTDEAFEGYEISNSDCIICNSHDAFVKQINDFLDSTDTFFSEKNRELFLCKYENNAIYEYFKKFMDESLRAW